MSDPPAPGDRRADGDRGDRAGRPMTIGMACGWTFGVTLLFLWLLTLVLAVRPGAQYDLISMFGCQVVAYLVGLFGVLRVHAPNASIRDFIGLRPTHAAFYPLAVALGVAMEAPVTAVYQAVERRWPSPGDEAELVRLIGEAGALERVALALVLVLVGPALEEVLFRGAFVRPLLRRSGAVAVVVTTAALFAIAHFQWQKFLPIAIFGVALGVLRVSSGSLLPPILLHATYNAIPFFALLDEARGRGAGAADPAEGRTVLEQAALSGDAPVPAWLVAAGAAAAVVMLALAAFVGARAEGAARAREKDLA